MLIISAAGLLSRFEVLMPVTALPGHGEAAGLVALTLLTDGRRPP